MAEAVRRPRVLLLCGGRSEEHDVSLASARSVLEATGGDADVTPLVIHRDGRLLSARASRAALGAPARERDALPTGGQEARADGPADGSTSGSASGSADGLADGLADGPADGPADGLAGSLQRLRDDGYDVVFPLLHGPFGEDGSVQGLLKVMGLPFVGSDVLGSAVGMDKLMMKAVFAAHGLPQVGYAGVTRHAWRADPAGVLERLAELRRPLFVKPANLGSSIGIQRVDDAAALGPAIAAALGFDRRVIVEEGVEGARELEVGVLGNDVPRLSPVGEIRYAAGFYDYDAKYTDGRAELLIPAAVSEDVAARTQALARRAFEAVDAAGLARVDFFYRAEEDLLLLNEINTMPGFTRHSMYPKLWEAGGVPYGELVRQLLGLALEGR